MTHNNQIRIEHLGQTGLKINLNSLTILVDPYLSHSVEKLDSSDLVRQLPIPYQANELRDVDWVFITHEHMDHCDPETIPALAEASPQCHFMGPHAVREQLHQWGIHENQILAASSFDLILGDGLSVRSIAAAHPTIRRDKTGCPQAVGYIFTYQNRVMYVAGDTSVCDEMIEILQQIPRIDIALLPVNEDNYFRRRRGIVGNMSVREAFELAQEVKISKVIPVHWDMFKCNGTSKEEIMGVYNSRVWNFELGSTEFIDL